MGSVQGDNHTQADSATTPESEGRAQSTPPHVSSIMCADPCLFCATPSHDAASVIYLASVLS
jgi:hypothetical protein